MTKAQRKKMIEETFTGTQVGMVLENVRDDFKVIAEQHTDIIKNINGLKIEVNDMKSEIKEIKSELGEFKDEMGEFRNETKANFKAVFDYLSRIEDDFVALKEEVERLGAKETNSKDFKWLKNKVLEIEKKLEEYKKQQTMLSAKM